MLADIKAILQYEGIENIPQSLCILISKKTSASVLLLDDLQQKLAQSIFSGNEPFNNYLRDLDLHREHISGNYMVLPLMAQGENIASLVLHKDSAFSEQELILIDAVVCVLSIIMLHSRHARLEAQAKKMSVVKSAIGTLSYSELEAILAVFDEINGYEALIIASKISEKTKITRSIIVNAFRKLESAGVIETRSLGVKGTHVRVLNENLIDELKKYRK